MFWNNNKELSLMISCIKSPLWNEGLKNFGNKCLLRELLQKCSGNKIIEMLKEILSAEEKAALVKTELELFFKNQAQSFENHMKIKSEIKSLGAEVNIKNEPSDQYEMNHSDIHFDSNTQNDDNLQNLNCLDVGAIDAKGNNENILPNAGEKGKIKDFNSSLIETEKRKQTQILGAPKRQKIECVEAVHESEEPIPDIEKIHGHEVIDENFMNEIIPSIISEVIQEQYLCYICELPFLSRKLVNRHLLVAHQKKVYKGKSNFQTIFFPASYTIYKGY